ncbi:MAG: pyridoxamine 5'-phosphate oxidase family protein [Candidatus Sungbacteria bacterium]|nr:pyridoxamine 5'-phosphate oxidase family protein [Candidatus Sungbacteria bacterium]
MNKLLDFLRSQKLLVVACHDKDDIWIANVYFGVDDNFKIYFISPENTKHSQLIAENPAVAFSVAWFNPNNHKDRKAIQGLGVCRPAKTEEEIAEGVRLHNHNFPEFKNKITVEWIHTNEYKSRVWIIEPSYMKYWDDELYGDKETEEFKF